MTKVPLVIYEGDNRIVIGSCDVEKMQGGGLVLDGIIEDENYTDILQGKWNPDNYSVSLFMGEEPVEVTYAPPPVIPKGRAQFLGVIPPQQTERDRNDD